MSEDDEFLDANQIHGQTEEEQAVVELNEKLNLGSSNLSSLLAEQGHVEPPRELPKRSYSLEPDMATGWKPKKHSVQTLNNVFPISYKSSVVDSLVRELYKKKFKEYSLTYLGPRRQNSYLLHENRKYQNPYSTDKKLDAYSSDRPSIPMNPTVEQIGLKFNSNFQCGNLDVAVHVSSNEYDLFMRVDSNTRGHNNWYYFNVENQGFVGTVRFNICNFKREKSLYQRGLRPYVQSKLSGEGWRQTGENIKYEKRKLRYRFLYEDEELSQVLKSYITLSFTYHFDTPNDTTQFAYFIPYSFTRLVKFVAGLKNVKFLPPLKSLSGLSMPVLLITDEKIEDYNKSVILVTARVHPGESNSSFVAEGFLQYVCGDQLEALETRKQFIIYMVPMLNPDGVIAGNYRTSLFGRDLNRTFNSGRKYAFPQSFHTLELARDLKSKHKQRFTTYIDLHGHSVKKNVFMYGPQFGIQNPRYYVSKELPKILSSISPYFRYHSCIFRISSEKSSTGRAMINRTINVPFTYTMESSSGFYFDSELKKDVELNSKKLKKMGVFLCQALNIFKKNQHNATLPYQFKNRIDPQNSNASGKQHDDKSLFQPSEDSEKQLPMSDDNISEGDSDSQPESEDLSETELQKIVEAIQAEGLSESTGQDSPTYSATQHLIRNPKLSEKSLKNDSKVRKKNNLLPPINCLKRAKQKKSNLTLIENKLKCISIGASPQKQKKNRLSISQMVQDARLNIERKEEKPQKLIDYTIFRSRNTKNEHSKAKYFLRDKG